LKVTVANRQTIDAIEIKIVKLEIYVRSEKVELFAYYMLSDIKFWYHCLGYTEQSRFQQ
jgi:hypothetical protein